MKVALLTTDNRQAFRQYEKPAPYFGTAPEALMQGFERLPDLEVHVVSCTRQPVKAPEKLAPNIYFHSLVVPKNGWMRTLYQGCIRATRKKLQEIKPDIVHGQGTEFDCAISAAFSGFPNVLTIHGNMRLIAKVNQVKPFSFNWLAARLEAFTLPRTNGVVCITNYTKRAVADLAKRTWLLPNAVDISFFDIEARPDPSAVPVGICVGQVCLRKNQNAFIRALDSLAGRKKFKIIFLGLVEADDYGREFTRLVQDRPWCEHAGFAGRDALRKYFQRANFAVLPTLEDNCPMVVLEAMASGVPVVASNVGGIPDLIQPEVTGLFGDPVRLDTFTAGIERLLDDKDFAQKLATAAKVEARRRFHPLVVARGHMEIYRDALEKAWKPA